MVNVGAHVSISGGIYKAVPREKKIGGSCGQIFSHSPRSWKFEVPSKKSAQKFQKENRKANIKPFVIHESYLTNLATPKDKLYKKSLHSTQKELDTARRIGIRYVNIHPGAHTGTGKKSGIDRLATALNSLEGLEDVSILIENTSGGGTKIGYNFRQLAEIIDKVEINVGITLDTCHLFCSGYDIATENGLNKTLKEFERVIGLDKLKLIHLNDSKHGLNSKKDVHEHIGIGKIGEEGMYRIINDHRLKNLPFILETPEDGKGDDKRNIQKVKKLSNEND